MNYSRVTRKPSLRLSVQAQKKQHSSARLNEMIISSKYDTLLSENFTVLLFFQRIAKLYSSEIWIALLNVKFNFANFHFLKFAETPDASN